MRCFSVLVALCLLLTTFAGAQTASKIYLIDEIDMAVAVPNSLIVIDLNEFETLEEDIRAATLEKVGELMAIAETDMNLYMLMEEGDMGGEDYLLGVVLSLASEEAISFRDLTDEEFAYLDALYSAIFESFEMEGVTIQANMLRTAHENWLYLGLDISGDDGTHLFMEYYITYVGKQAYVFGFASDSDSRHELVRQMMETVVFDRTTRFPGGFLDMAGHWAAEDVVKAVDLGLFKGNTALEFAPDAGMTRAMLVQVLYRMEGQPEAGESKFSDVAADAWYADAVAWASENGIVKGSGGKFNPDGLLTREQLATILWRYAKYEGRDVSVGEDTNILSYNDAFSISEYAYAPMQWACGDGLIKGASGNLMPQGTTTRAQVATILVRYLTEAKVQVIPRTEDEDTKMRTFEVKELDVRLSVPAAATTVGPEELEPDDDAEDMDSYWWELYQCLDYVGQEEFADSLLPKFRFEEMHDDKTVFVGYAAAQEVAEDVAGPSFEAMENMSDGELREMVDYFKELQQQFPLEGLASDAVLYRNEQTSYVRLLHTTSEADGNLWVDIYMTDYETTPYVFVFWGTEPSDRARAEAIMDTVVLKQSVK